MALFKWKCQRCRTVTRKLATERPVIGICECGGVLEFVNNTQSLVMERLDNGVMPRVVERLKDAEELVKTQSQGKEEDHIV